MPDPATPVAEAPEQASVAAAEPAPAKTSPSDAPLSGFAEALRAGGQGALKERSNRSARRAAEAPPEASAKEGSEESSEASKSDAVKPGESPPEAGAEPGLSRRGAAKALSEKDRELADMKAKWEADQRAVAERDGRLKELTAKQKASQDFVLSKIGKDEDFERLQSARMRREWMSAEDDDALDTMLLWREHAGAIWDLADSGHRKMLARDLDEVVSQYGLDRKTAFGATAPALAAHVAETVEKRVRGEVADELKTLKQQHRDKVSELEKELSSLRPLAAHRTPAPTVGGMSAPSGVDLGEHASPLARMAAAFRTGPPRRGGGSPSRRAS